MARKADRTAIVISVSSSDRGAQGRTMRVSHRLFVSAIVCGAAGLIAFFGIVVLFINTDARLERVARQLQDTLVHAEKMDTDMERLVSAANKLEQVIGDADAVRSADESDSVSVPVRFDGLSNTRQQEEGYVERVLQSARLSFQDIAGKPDSENGFLSDIPSIWPLQNNHGNVTLEFGPNRHPKTNQWYLHKGIDIAGAYGVKVLASANGKVIESGYNGSGYGNYILVRHKYGFRTRYSHLSGIYVAEGQPVTQGEIIGTLGSTGISTGPHLDFQIMLGTDVIDPAQFLKISRQQFRRWAGNRY